MLMENNTQLHLLHQRLLLMMSEIHRICIENDIKYTLMGGSLIGAIRHKGFIPWDDDLDVGLEWRYFKKFVDIVFTTKHDWLEFTMAGKTDDFGSVIIRAYDSRTTLVNNTSDKPHGVCIDIIPISYAGNSKLMAKFNFFRHRFYMMLVERKYHHFKGKNKIKEWVLHKLSELTDVKWLMNRIFKMQDRLCRKYKKYSSDFSGNLHGIVPTECFDEYTFYPFENEQFMSISNADIYLRYVFGDYMQFPPEKERVPKHMEYLNLDLPYREYKKK